MAYLSLFLLIVCIPLGVAAQNIGVGIVAVILLWRAIAHGNVRNLKDSARRFIVPIFLSLLFLLVHFLSSLLNADYPGGWSVKFLGGYVAWALLPFLLVVSAPPMKKENWYQLAGWMAAISLLVGLITFSQYLWGWRIQGAELVSDGNRARGLYSHPLTLAYVALILYSVGLSFAFSFPRSVRAWLWPAGAGLALVMSLSKTVLAVAFCLTAFWLLVKLRGRWRFAASGILLAALALTAFTENPISRRFSHVVRGVDVSGDRIDDRIIFWDVAIAMAKERPVLGHGPDLSTEYRRPYYRELGYGDMEKQYEAHNTFLQVLVTGGALGLTLFLAIGLWYWRVGWGLSLHPAGSATLSLLVSFGIASLTQNSFQDSEVRFTLAVASSFLWLFLRDKNLSS